VTRDAVSKASACITVQELLSLSHSSVAQETVIFGKRPAGSAKGKAGLAHHSLSSCSAGERGQQVVESSSYCV